MSYPVTTTVYPVTTSYLSPVRTTVYYPATQTFIPANVEFSAPEYVEVPETEVHEVEQVTPVKATNTNPEKNEATTSQVKQEPQLAATPE